MPEKLFTKFGETKKNSQSTSTVLTTTQSTTNCTQKSDQTVEKIVF